MHQSSSSQVFYKKVVLKIFGDRCFPVSFAKIFRTTFYRTLVKGYLEALQSCCRISECLEKREIMNSYGWKDILLISGQFSIPLGSIRKPMYRNCISAWTYAWIFEIVLPWNRIRPLIEFQKLSKRKEKMEVNNKNNKKLFI